MVAIWHVFLVRLGWKARKILGAHFQLFPIEWSIFLSNFDSFVKYSDLKVGLNDIGSHIDDVIVDVLTYRMELTLVIDKNFLVCKVLVIGVLRWTLYQYDV